MELEERIKITCLNGNIDQNEFLKIRSEINEKNYLSTQDFDNLLQVGFPIGLELKRLKKTENITEIRDMVANKEVSAADFVAIILSNIYYDQILIMHPLKNCNE